MGPPFRSGRGEPPRFPGKPKTCIQMQGFKNQESAPELFSVGLRSLMAHGRCRNETPDGFLCLYFKIYNGFAFKQEKKITNSPKIIEKIQKLYLLKKKGNNAYKTVISTNKVRRNLDCKEISRFARNPPPIWQARLSAQTRLPAQTRGP